MKKATERRLAAAERLLLSEKGSLQVIIIHGGFSGPPRLADVGGRILERAGDETLDAFEKRVINDAKAANLKSVVIGGLPPNGVELGTSDEFLSRFQFSEVPPEEPY
ncbi:MAG: hypothetical protein Q7T45_14405 [Bradyrhizobium sp.]|uniref:hypothetical protein n=1 Tax=Bradyrhizobium sp. TaxID=376 RepID=UPI002729206F|nr:hypothetical protein [Bradyrhizobium sp.]MDO8399005.1 hypothetical protein [Bradyrhizobium sp.]